MYKTVKVEVNALLGTFVDVEVYCDNEGYPEIECLYDAVRKAIIDKFGVDNSDAILNSITINGWKFK